MIVPATGDAKRTLTSLRQRVLHEIRTLAAPHRLRVGRDAEGFAIIPGRYGRIEWFCDGIDCCSCPLPGQVLLAVYSDRPRLFARLRAVPGVRPHQTGDTEMRAVFAPEQFDQIAGIIKARRRRSLSPEEARRRGFKPTHRATSGT